MQSLVQVCECARARGQKMGSGSRRCRVCVCVWAKCERVVRGVSGECRAVLAFHGSPSPTEGFEGTERDSLKLSLW